MQTQQGAVLKEYLDIVFRRKWWILIPTIVGLLFSSALFMRFPKKYKTTTRVQIRSQQISRQLLNPTVDIRSEELVTQLQAEITSEKYMQQLDDRLHLVGKPGGPRDLPELARAIDNSSTLEPNTRNRYFDLTISWGDPRIAASVANELAAIYIEANRVFRSGIATGTLEKLRNHRVEVQTKLEEVRALIERFRSEHKFEIGAYEPTNLQQVEVKRGEINSLDRDIRSYDDRIAEIELQLSAGVVTGPDATQTDPRRTQLETLKADLAALRSQGRTDNHPDVKVLQRKIDVLTQQLGITDNNPEGLTPEQLARQRLQQEREQAVRDRQIAQQKRTSLAAEIAGIQSRLSRTPDWQIQLDKLSGQELSLSREFDEAKKKEQDALQGQQVEDFEQGERFEILNKAVAPRQAYWPDLKMFLLMGLAVGGGLGVAMVLLLEVFDQSFKSEEQLAAAIDLPTLAVIPDLNKAEALKRTGRGRRAPPPEKAAS